MRDGAAVPRFSPATRALLVRIALVPVFVALCYLLDWTWLRALTESTLLQLSVWLGVPMRPIGAGLVGLDGLRIEFVVACTMVDAFFGAIPLLWRTGRGFTHSYTDLVRSIREDLWPNLLLLAAVFLGVFALNIFRLELGFVAFHRGVPWWLAHEVVAGFAYFALFLFIMHRRAWAR